MNIYIAGAYSRQSELRIVAVRLAWAGNPCTSRWLKIETKSLAEGAAVDVYDIKRADLILRFSDPEYMDESSDTVPRRLLSAARMTEVGLGLAWKKKVAVIGGHQNAFDHLPQVMHFDTLEDFMQWLQVFESVESLLQEPSRTLQCGAA